MEKRSHSIPCDSSSNVKYEGTLDKLGKLTGSLMGKKYYCVLDYHRLSYYKLPNKVCDGSFDPLFG